jgi:hypothetical protein
MVGLIFAAWLLTLAVVAVGDALAVGIVLWSAHHLYRGRPRWYVAKIVRGGLVGAAAGLAIGVLTAVSAQGGLQGGPSTGALVVVNLILAGFGWTALAPARRHAPFRLASSGPPSAA